MNYAPVFECSGLLYVMNVILNRKFYNMYTSSAFICMSRNLSVCESRACNTIVIIMFEPCCYDDHGPKLFTAYCHHTIYYRADQ